MYTFLVSLAVLLLVLTFSVSCALGSDRDPLWVENLISQLRCGLTLADVERMVDREIEEEDSLMARLGSHRIDGKWATVWLDFTAGELAAVASGRIDGVASMRTSPKRNLCTGELTFLLQVGWVTDLRGATIFLDGQMVEENAIGSFACQIPAGTHHLRLEKDGFLPIRRKISLEPGDPGVYQIDLGSHDLRPEG